MSRDEVIASLAGFAHGLDPEQDTDTTLRSITGTAVRSLPGIDHAGISTFHSGGKVTTRAATDPLVEELDRSQYELDEGPCLDAIRHDPIVLVNEVRHEQRWPRYVRGAVDLGVTAQLGLRLYIDGDTLGALNLYSTTTEQIDPEVVGLADLFAGHAALALGFVRRSDELNRALRTRTVIGQATGILMATYGLDEDAAFGYLRRVSSHTNTKVHDIAAELVRKTVAEHHPDA